MASTRTASSILPMFISIVDLVERMPDTWYLLPGTRYATKMEPKASNNILLDQKLYRWFPPAQVGLVLLTWKHSRQPCELVKERYLLGEAKTAIRGSLSCPISVPFLPQLTLRKQSPWVTSLQSSWDTSELPQRPPGPGSTD